MVSDVDKDTWPTYLVDGTKEVLGDEWGSDVGHIFIGRAQACNSGEVTWGIEQEESQRNSQWIMMGHDSRCEALKTGMATPGARSSVSIRGDTD